MAYIYKITNDINDKIYIGKTEFSIEKRFKEHCRDAFKEHCNKRPLYNAMNKYGIEHFHIEEIEQTDNPEEREIYWIEYYGSFKYGYNATKGGDGRKYLDYDLIIAAYKELQDCVEVAKTLNIDVKTVERLLKAKNIKAVPSSIVLQKKYGKPVLMLNKSTEEIIKVFPSFQQAGLFLIENKLSNCKIDTIRTHISEAARGKRKSAAGFKWKISE